MISAVLGKNWCVRIEELGAFMTYIAINGEGEDVVIENAWIVEKRGQGYWNRKKIDLSPSRCGRGTGMRQCGYCILDSLARRL